MVRVAQISGLSGRKAHPARVTMLDPGQKSSAQTAKEGDILRKEEEAQGKHPEP